jgi:hypothetical protein
VEFGWREVDCFFRPQALECDRRRPGAGLLFLFLSSLYRAFGPRGFFATPGKGHFSFLEEVFSPASGIDFVVVRPRARGEVRSAIRDLVDDHGACIVPTNVRHLPYFEGYQREDRAHYFVVTGYDAGHRAYEVVDSLHVAADHSSTRYLPHAIREELFEQLVSDYESTYVDGVRPDPYRAPYYWILAVDHRVARASTDALDDVSALVTSRFVDEVRRLDDATAAHVSVDERRLADLEAAIERGDRDTADTVMRSYLAEANFAAVHLTIILQALSTRDPPLHRDAVHLVDAWRRSTIRTRSELLIKAMLPAGVQASQWAATRSRLAEQATELARTLAKRLEHADV